MSHVSSSPSQNTRPARIQQLFRGSFKRYGCHEKSVALKQGPRSLEQHIREFLVFANYSDLPDITLIEIFCDGINQPLRSEFRREGTRASLAQFLDYALLTVGSSFTVGVAEERDTAPNCVNTATLEHAHQMAATTTPRSVIAANLKASQVTADVKESSQVTADVKESSHR